MEKQTIAVLFGGKATEHEVSVITGIQAIEHIDKSKYNILPIYVSKDNEFYTSPKLAELKNYADVQALMLSSTKIVLGKKDGRGGYWTFGLRQKFTPIDVALLAFHGTYGEDGAVQGMLDIAGIAYTSCGVAASAVAMDKVFAKAVFAQLHLPQAEFVVVHRSAWQNDQDAELKRIMSSLPFPLFVKPATIGSSIGVGKAKDEDELSFAIEVAASYSEKILIEKAFENVIEVNCSALGFGEDVQASVCEQPVASSDVLSFEDKYQKGGKGSKGGGMASLSRIIPAPISDGLSKDIQQAAVEVFKALESCGVVRIDFFVDKDHSKFWINEINPIPGSLSFYLWEKTDLPYEQLLDRLIDLARRRQKEQQKTQYTFNSGLLEQMAKSGGSSGSKGSK